MASDDRYWNRDELYEEVWTTPMKTLAKKYGLSDVGLAKTCRKLSIPLPGRGYWARKEAGQKVEQVALPPLKEKIVLQRPTPRAEPPKLTDFATADEIVQIEQLEETAGESLLKRGSLSHPLIAQARGAFKHAQVSDSTILWTQEGCLDIRVSKESLDRAFRIMASVIAAIEEQGFTVAVETRREITSGLRAIRTEPGTGRLADHAEGIGWTPHPQIRRYPSKCLIIALRLASHARVGH